MATITVSHIELTKVTGRTVQLCGQKDPVGELVDITPTTDYTLNIECKWCRDVFSRIFNSITVFVIAHRTQEQDDEQTLAYLQRRLKYQQESFVDHRLARVIDSVRRCAADLEDLVKWYQEDGSSYAAVSAAGRFVDKVNGMIGNLNLGSLVTDAMRVQEVVTEVEAIQNRQAQRQQQVAG